MRFFWFVVKKISIRFLLVFLLMTVVFTVGNLFSRPIPFLGLFPSVKLVGLIFLVMATYTVPFALGFAGYSIIADFVESEEINSIHFFASLNASLWQALYVVSLLCGALYSYLLFSLAPYAYAQSKYLLVGALHEYMQHIPAHTMQKIGSNVVMHCDHNKLTAYGANYQSLFFGLHHKNNLCAFFAEKAKLCTDTLECTQGSIVIAQQDNPYCITFQKASLSLEQLVQEAMQSSKKTPERFASGSTLYREYDNANMRKELYKRIGQLWWLFITLLLMVLFSLYDTSKKNRSVRGIVISGIFFILSYGLIAAGHALGGTLFSFLVTSVCGSCVSLLIYIFLKK